MIRLYGTGWTVGAKRMLAAAVRTPKIIDQVVAREAHRFRNEVVKAFREQSGGGKKWSPRKRITDILAEAGVGQGGGGSKALVRTGTLRNSTKVNRRGYAAYFVSQHRTGKRGADVARIHDQGPTKIPISKRMRNYFMYLFFKGVIPFPWPPRRARFIIIPRRSSMTDVFEKFKTGSRARVIADFAAQMRTL